jgi:hypothetical protein
LSVDSHFGPFLYSVCFVHHQKTGDLLGSTGLAIRPQTDKSVQVKKKRIPQLGGIGLNENRLAFYFHRRQLKVNQCFYRRVLSVRIGLGVVVPFAPTVGQKPGPIIELQLTPTMESQLKPTMDSYPMETICFLKAAY